MNSSFSNYEEITEKIPKNPQNWQFAEVFSRLPIDKNNVQSHSDFEPSGTPVVRIEPHPWAAQVLPVLHPVAQRVEQVMRLWEQKAMGLKIPEQGFGSNVFLSFLSVGCWINDELIWKVIL